MKLKVVQHEENIFSIQKVSLSKWTKLAAENCGRFNGDGRFALVPLSDNASCICKLFFEQDIHPSFLYLDTSVIHVNTMIDNYLPQVPLKMEDTYIHAASITILPPITYIKNLSLSVIVENISDLKKWEREEEKLKFIVCEILKLFVITQDSVVFLRNLKEGLKHSIHAIVVHRISPSEDEISPVRVTSNTVIELVRIASKFRFEQVQGNSLVSKVGGLEGPAALLKNIIHDNILFKKSCTKAHPFLKPTKQVLLSGPSGCGKTSLVRQIAAESGSTLLSVVGPEIVSSKPGATEEALRRVFENALIIAEEDENAVCILSLEEVDILCPRRDLHHTSAHSMRVSVQLLTMLEQVNKTPGLVIIATTSKPFLLDPSARRPGRLETEVHIGVPNEADRECILLTLLGPLKPPDMCTLAKHVASLTPGYVGADLALVCQEVSLLKYRRLKKKNDTEEKSLTTWILDFKKSVTNIKPSALRSGLGVILTSPTTMDSIGGLDDIKRELRVAVEWPLIHPDAFARLGLPQLKGVLLYGPPGCAKTSIARALASETNTTFLSVSAADLYSPYVGEAERNITELFRRARAGAPTILFIDEIDALTGTRGERERGVNEQVLSALLTEMDGVGVRLDDSKMAAVEQSLHKDPVSSAGVMVVAATNRPDMLDDALIRPGRFDKLLYVPAPHLKERHDILLSLTANMPLADDVDLSYVAEHTKLFSGADLAHLCKEAALHALTQDGMTANQIKQAHFVAALQILRPSLSETQIRWYESYRGKK